MSPSHEHGYNLVFSQLSVLRPRGRDADARRSESVQNPELAASVSKRIWIEICKIIIVIVIIVVAAVAVAVAFLAPPPSSSSSSSSSSFARDRAGDRSSAHPLPSPSEGFFAVCSHECTSKRGDPEQRSLPSRVHFADRGG